MTTKLPEILRSLFWSYHFEDLRLPIERDLVMLHVLTYGNAKQKSWLCKRYKNKGITTWIVARKGRGLTIAQISPWVSASQGRKWQKHNDGDRIWENR